VTPRNCWQVMRCGREPHGVNAAAEGICPVPTFFAADGFCGGRNGGRACYHIRDLLRARGTPVGCVSGECPDCTFGQSLHAEHRSSGSVEAFIDYICGSLGTRPTARMLRMLFERTDSA
jgi:hypothetical protein